MADKIKGMLSGIVCFTYWWMGIAAGLVIGSSAGYASDIEEIQILNSNEVLKSATCYCNRIVNEHFRQSFPVTRFQHDYHCSPAGHIWKHALAAAIPEALTNVQNAPIVINNFLYSFETTDLVSGRHAVDKIAGRAGFKRILILSHYWSQANDEIVARLMRRQYQLGNSAQYIVFNSLGNKAAVRNMLHVAELEHIDLIVALDRALVIQLTEIYGKGSIPVKTIAINELKMRDIEWVSTQSLGRWVSMQSHLINIGLGAKDIVGCSS